MQDKKDDPNYELLICKLCDKTYCRYDMYLHCHICHDLFSCFFCGSQERQKYFDGLPSKVYNRITYKIKCPKHFTKETEECEMGESCKICFIRKM
jgi:hypothetical protein